MPFPFKYMEACVHFESRRVKEALAVLYALQRETEAALVSPPAPQEQLRTSDAKEMLV